MWRGKQIYSSNISTFDEPANEPSDSAEPAIEPSEPSTEPIDNDGDGYISELEGGDDCDDDNADVYPNAEEIPEDGIDQDCDRIDLIYADNDGDGSKENVDCDDNDATVYPDAEEIPDDGIDQDCDGEDLVPEDIDGDGYNSLVDCNDLNFSTSG